MTLESFSKVYNDDRVSEIVIVDDGSTPDIYQQLYQKTFSLDKVHLMRSAVNKDCYQNKMAALSFAKNDFAILLDSDNIISTEYLDLIFRYEWASSIIMAPVFAAPNFDYRDFSGLTISKTNVSQHMDRPMFSTALNTANFFVHACNYIKVWDEKVDPVTADSIYMAYRWLDAGFKIHFVDGLQYFHRVHEGSHYKQNVSRTPTGFLRDVEKKLRELK